MLKRQPLTGTDADYNTAEANFPNAFADPFMVDLSLTSSINLDPMLETLRSNKKTKVEEDIVSEKNIKEIIRDLEDEVVNEETCGNVVAVITTTAMKHTLPKGTETMKPDEDPGLKRALDESKKIVENFRDKISKYPRHMSYEGSMVMCIMIALGGGKETEFSLGALPKVDQKLIKSLMPEGWKDVCSIRASLDEGKDFVIKVPKSDIMPLFAFTLFNTVAHPRPEDLQDINQIPIEEKGGILRLGGGAINFDKQRLADLAALPSQQREERVDVSSGTILKTTNKNAYEIRESILEKAVDVVKLSRGSESFGVDSFADKVLQIASRFYDFVENKRYNK